jgi:hypothetical protein
MNEFLQRLKERKLVQLEIRLVLPTLRPPRTGQGGAVVRQRQEWIISCEGRRTTSTGPTGVDRRDGKSG